MTLDIGVATKDKALRLLLKQWADALSVSDLAGISAYILTLLDDANAAAAQATLGLGTAATKNTGTSGNTVPLLDGANSWSGSQTFSAQANFFTSSDYGTAVYIEGTSAGAGGPLISTKHNSASPANSDTLLLLYVQGKDGSGGTDAFCQMYAQATNVTAGAEAGRWAFNTAIAGTGADRLYIGHGLYTANASSSDMGADSINASTYYRNGVALGWRRHAIVGTTSGTTQSTTSIPACSAIMLVLNGVSHNSGSNQSIRVALSSDNGSSYGTARQVTESAGSGNAFHGQVWIMEVGVNGNSKDISPNTGPSGASSGYRDLAVESTVTGVINALQFSPSGGSFDAGAVIVYYA